MRHNIVPRYAFAFGIHDAEVPLRIGHSLLGGPSVPLRRLGVVLRYALALVVHEAEVMLGFGDSVLSGHSVPLQCLGVILRDASTVIVHDAEVVLSLGVSFFSQWLHQSKCCCIVAPLIGGSSILELSPARRNTH